MPAAWAQEVLDAAPYITVSMTQPDGTPYAVPLSLARGSENVFYFHGAPVGLKMETLKHHPEVCLSAVTKCKPVVGPKDNSFTLEYRSAIAFGRAELVTDETERIEAMRAICQRFLPHHMAAFDEAVKESMSHTAIVRITLTAPPTGKRKEYDMNGDEMKYGRMK